MKKPEDRMSELAQSDMNAFTAGMADFPGFNFEGLAALVEDTNDETALKIIARFRTTLEAGLRELDAAVASRSGEVFWKVAHRFAGTAELIGFEDFGRGSKELSQALKGAPDVESYGSAIAKYLEHCRKILTCLNGFGWLTRYL